jgi:cysteine-rich repeat protein
VVDGSAVAPADADDAFGVAVDAAGDVIVGGQISDATTDDDLVVMKLAGATGDEVWRTTVKGNNANDDDAAAVALDAAGNALVVGSVRNSGRGRDLFLGKFANATGVEAWRLEVDGTESAGDFGNVIALGAAGDPVAGGRLRNGATGNGYTIVKLTGANGADFPCANGTQDPGEGCDDGNITPGDGCRADCTAEICGDGIKDPQESCDDGNTADGDCCSATCTAEPDGSACDDANACTLGESCKAAVCTPAGVVVCTAPGPCFDSTCNTADGTCSTKARAEGALCDDSDACTVLDRCIGGTCTGSIPPVCADDDPCTLDRCDPAVGCVSDPLTGFDSVTCVLEPDDIATACGAAIPRPLQATLEKIDSFLAKGAGTTRVAKQRRMLGRASSTMKRGIRLTAKKLKKDDVTQGCADTLTRTFNDLATRATGLRAELASGS